MADGYNWYLYCLNDPINMADPSGEDAIIITNNDAAVYQGHTSAVYQDASGNWYYTYWGSKAAAVIRIDDKYMGSLNDFNTGLNKFLSDYGLSNITSNYTNATYVVGDFTESLKAAYDDVYGANRQSEGSLKTIGQKRNDEYSGSVIFQGKNKPYNLFCLNCLDKTYASLSRGTLANGMNAGQYMSDCGFSGGMRPNNAIEKFKTIFISDSFTYAGSYDWLKTYVLLYYQGSSSARSWQKFNYAKSAIGW